MKTFLIHLNLLVLLILIQGNAWGQEKTFDPEKIRQIKYYESTQLENGLTVIRLKSNDTINSFVRAYTNLPEYVSKNFRNVLEIENELRKIKQFMLPAGWAPEKLKHLEIDLKRDQYGYFAQCPNTCLDTALLLFSDLFQKPVVDMDKIEQSKRKIFERTDSLEKLPEDKIDKITKSIIYGEGHPILRHFNRSEINAVKQDDYLDFYEKFYRPNNSYLVVIGTIELDSLKILATNAMGKWKKKEIPSADYKLIPIDEPKIVFFDTIPSGQTDIKILFPFALHPYTFDSEKAELISTLFQDVLTIKLIQNKQLANKINAKFESDKITGNYQLQVQLVKDSLNPVIQTIVETIAEFNAGKFQEDKVLKAKKEIIDRFKTNHTDDAYISWLIINTDRNNLSKTYYAEFINDIEKTDNQALKTFSAKYLNYRTALFQIPGHWYGSLNDFIKLSKDFRIELYNLGGQLKKLIPKGFNGFSVIDNYVAAVGGEHNINKIKEVKINYGAIYEMPANDQIFVEGIIIHKDNDKYYAESYVIRPRKDTLFLEQEIYSGMVGLDSTMQGRKKLQGTELELLKYKAPFVPETKYRDWLYKANLLRADTLDGKYVWVVALESPVKQQIIDYYDVDNGLKYKRIIKDALYLNERVIQYSKYQKDKDNEILYPYLKVIIAPETTIRMRAREIDYNARSDKKLFEVY